LLNIFNNLYIKAEFANLIINSFFIRLYPKVKYIIKYIKLNLNDNSDNLLNKKEILTKVDGGLIETKNKKENKSKINRNINIDSDNWKV